MKNIYYLIFCLFLLGCNDNDFSPYESAEDKIVAYCILDTRNDKQYVKIQKIYMDNNTISEEEFKGLKVIISEVNGASFYLKDTVIDKINNFVMYYADFKISKGKSMN
jgi:hypothetical protein